MGRAGEKLAKRRAVVSITIVSAADRNPALLRPTGLPRRRGSRCGIP